MIPNRTQAPEMFEEIIAVRNASNFPFTAEQERAFRAHCTTTALAAEKLTSAIGLNAETAFVYGLLHDCGRIKDEKAEDVFHGYVGYEYMLSKGCPEIARISITHSFYKKDFCFNTYPQNKSDLEKCHIFLQEIEYNDYDLVLQLADMTNQMGEYCSLETRLADISYRYNISIEKLQPQLSQLQSVKNYLENKHNIDIYALLGIEK